MTQSTDPGSGLVSARGFWLPVRRYLLLVIFFCLLGLAGAAAYGLLAPERYMSRATVQIGGGASPFNDSLARPLPPNTAAEASVARSISVAKLAVARIGGSESPEAVLERLDVATPTDANTLELSYSGPTPEQARDGAQAFADSYIAYRTDALEKALGSARPMFRVNPGTVLSPAQLPTSPSGLPLGVVLAIGAAIGALVGWAVVVLRSRIDERVFTIDDAESAGVSGLGVLDGSLHALVTVVNRLVLALDTHGARSLLIAEGEDVRGAAHESVIDALVEVGRRSSTKTVVLRLEPTRVISRQHVRQMIDSAREDGLVVVVSGPITTAPSALVAATAVDAVLLTGVLRRTSTAELRDAATDVTSHGGHVLGVVLASSGARRRRQIPMDQLR